MEGTRVTGAPRRGLPRTREEYRALVDAAVARSALARLPAPALRRLVERGIRLDAKARTTIYREGDAPMVVLVVHGTLRIYATAEDGREFTLFWAHPGDWLGHILVVGGPTDVSAQAVSDAALHVVPAELLESLARTDTAVAWELLRATSFRVRQLVGSVRMLVFMDLRQRMSHQLVELAFRQPAGSALVAEVSQQDLADLVGSPRTSIARILADLREEGIVRTVPRGIQILRPERLVPNRVATATG
ncbi:MAG TPA: Crp/Fnr family transcriptional regulator [Candidatus Limnocylindria bacterium]|nr:Crp/Fnr family transcriptional regulator [Candidatus Limnocylindria bacterium]